MFRVGYTNYVDLKYAYNGIDDDSIMFWENDDLESPHNFLNNSKVTIIDFIHFIANAHGFGILTQKSFTELPYDECLQRKKFSYSLVYFDLMHRYFDCCC